MRKAITILVGLFVVLVLLIAGVFISFDINQYKGEITQLVKEKTGRAFTIGGDLQLGKSLVPTVIMQEVHFGNAAWSTRPEMLHVGKLELQVSLLPLLQNTVIVNRLILNNPEIFLETDSKGRGNWILDIPADGTGEPVKTTKAEQSTLPALGFNEVHIKNARISYKDGMTGKDSIVNLDTIRMETGGLNETLDIMIKASYNDIPVSIKGSLGAVNQLIKNENYPVQLEINISDADIGVDGKIARPLNVSGLDLAIELNVKSLALLSELAGADLPDFGPVTFSVNVTDIKNGYAVKSMSLRAGRSDLSGEMTIMTAGTPPFLKAKLESNVIDSTAVTEDGRQTQADTVQDKSTKLFPAEPLPLEKLKSINVELELTVKQILAKDITLENTKLMLSLNSGKLSIKPFSTQLAGGTLESGIALDGSGEMASLSTDLNIRNLQPGLLPNLKDKITGTNTDVTIQAKGSGNSIAAIMAGLNGNVLVKTGAGQLKSEQADLATSGVFLKTYRMLNPEATGDQGTQIQCFVAKFDIKDGIAPVDRGIALETNHMNVIGSGNINFKTEELDLGVVPQAREGTGISVGQLAELVRLSGTFANPSIVPDTSAALKAGLSTGAAVATGGLSILAQGLFDRSTADKAPCANALGIKTSKSATPAVETTEKSTAEKAVDSVKDTGAAVGDKLKKLFGR